MSFRLTFPLSRRPAALAASVPALLAVLLAAPFTQALAQPTKAAAAAAFQAPVRAGDYIVAVVNSDSVTQIELDQRMAKLRADPVPQGQSRPSEAELRKTAMDQLVEERALATYARDNSAKIEDAEVDHAVDNVAAANRMSTAQLRDRLQAEGIDYGRFRENLRDQIAVERTREREVSARIKITDSEITDYMEQERAKRAAAPEIDLAQILITVPENASAEVRAEKEARAQQALARVKNGEPFEQVGREMSDDANRLKGGDMGMRPINRYPDLFVNAVANLQVGAVTPALVKSGAGYHILKVVSRSQDSGLMVTQTHARHILIRPSAQMTPEAVGRRLSELRDQIVSGKRSFEDVAKQYSEDGTAQQGGDLGWTSPGTFVPEFEQQVDHLDVNAISQPFATRFGVHIVQVLDRRQVAVDPKELREQARNALKEQKFEAAYNDWVADVRSKAFIEMREPPIR
jgi:peptidyl-prolyl cis-trans isomerase SurA